MKYFINNKEFMRDVEFYLEFWMHVFCSSFIFVTILHLLTKNEMHNIFNRLTNIFYLTLSRLVEPSNASATEAFWAPKVRKEGVTTYAMRGTGFRNEAG